MGMVRNLYRVNDGIELTIRRVGLMYVAHFREVTRAVFMEILKQTPQFTGKAVANWNIGVGSPDYSYDDTLGDPVSLSEFAPGAIKAHRKGHTKWIKHAMQSNEFKIAQIKRDSKVYITNGIRGDDDGGKSDPLYLEALQDPAYWSVKLRSENSPYETAQMTIQKMANRFLRRSNIEFRPGGANMAEYQ